MIYDLIISIDPGKGGAVTTFFKGAVKVYPMPYNPKEMEDLFNHFKEISDNPICFIEKVNLRPDDIGHFGKAIRIQKMLDHYTELKTILSTTKIPFIEVYPRSWQAKLGLSKLKGEEDKDRKNRYKESAQLKFKMIRCTLKNSDALLILNYGYYMVNNEPKIVDERLNTNERNLLS